VAHALVSCVPRRDSSRRSLVIYTISEEIIDKSLGQRALAHILITERSLRYAYIGNRGRGRH
jgi:hypothetical protein